MLKTQRERGACEMFCSCAKGVLNLIFGHNFHSHACDAVVIDNSEMASKEQFEWILKLANERIAYQN